MNTGPVFHGRGSGSAKKLSASTLAKIKARSSTKSLPRVEVPKPLIVPAGRENGRSCLSPPDESDGPARSPTLSPKTKQALEAARRRSSGSEAEPSASGSGGVVGPIRKARAGPTAAKDVAAITWTGNKPASKLDVTWACLECKTNCLHAGEETWCLCGHRNKVHNMEAAMPQAYRCASGKCACRMFFFHVAQGSWSARCRCKHRHTDHDPRSGKHPCTRASCRCAGFDSPFVCNCGHGWASHNTLFTKKYRKDYEGTYLPLAAGFDLAVPGRIKRENDALAALAAPPAE